MAPLLLVAGLVFVASRTMTLQWVAQQAVSLTGGRLQIDGITGSFLSEVAADSVRWQDARGSVTVTAPRFTYHPLALLDGLIRVERISAADIQVELPPAASSVQPREPIRLPQALAAVLPVAVERIDARRMVVRRAGVELTRLHNLEAVVRHDGDRLTLSLLNADVAAGHGGVLVGTVGIRGEVAVLSRAPYATDGRLLVQVPIGAQPLRVDVRINGPLEELSVRAVTAFAGAPVEVRSILYPLDARPLRHLRLDLKDFDLSRHDATLPVTRLSGSFEAEVMPAWANESKPLLIGPLNLANSIAGPLDHGFLPVASAKAVLGYVGERLEAQGLHANGPMGEIAGEGSIGPDGLRLALAGEKLLLRGIASTLAPRILAARIAIEPVGAGAGLGTGGWVGWAPGSFAGAAAGSVRTLGLEFTAVDATLSARMKGLLTGGRLQVSDAEVHSKPDRHGRSGQAAFRGSVGLARPWPMDLSGNFRDFDPGHLATLPPALLNGTWRLAGLASGADGGAFQAEVTLANSRLRGLPLAGRFAANLSADSRGPRRLRDVEADFQWGSGTVGATGGLGGPADTLHLVLDLPRVGEVNAALRGLLTAQGDLRGALREPSFEGTVQAKNLVSSAGGFLAKIAGAALQVRSAQVHSGVFDLQARLDEVDVAPLTASGAPAAAAGGVLRFDQVTAAFDGSAEDHETDLVAVGADRRISVSAKGGLGGDGQWRGVVREFAASHPLLKMPSRTVVSAAGARSGGGAQASANGAEASPKRAEAFVDGAEASVDGAEASVDGAEQLRLRQPFSLNAGEGRASARGASFDFQGAILNLKQADWRDPVLTLSADASGLAAGWLGRFMSLGGIEAGRSVAAQAAAGQTNSPGDLRLAATVDFIGSLADAGAAGWRGRVALQRESGDLFVAPPSGIGPVPAGLRTMQASASLNARDVQVVVNVDGENIGQIAGEARAVLQDGAGPVWSEASLARTALSGQVELATNSFRWISPLVGDNWLVDGALSARLQLAGTVEWPRVEGFISGSNLTAREEALGMRLSNGVLAAELEGGRVDVRLLRFESGEGSVAFSGLLQPQAYGRSQARVVIDRLPVALSAGERVVLSGSTAATLGQSGLAISGHLAVDEASIVLIDQGEPLVSGELRIRAGTGRDVPAVDHLHDPAAGSIVRRAGATDRNTWSHGRAGGSMTAGTQVGTDAVTGVQEFSIVTDMEVDLGRRFHVSGSGLDGHLRGTIRLLGSFPESPFVTGDVDLVGATYLVMGRKLKLRQGRLVFNGPMDDPVLDIVAIREHAGMESGIVLSGTASLPAVRLISDPELPDADKLAWLVLGTGLQEARGAGQLLVLQAVATNLFGPVDPGPVDPGPGRFRAREESRLDLPSLRKQEGDPTGGTAGEPDRARGTVAALGSRLSSRLAMTCEQSLRGVWDILRLQYEMTDRLSLSAQAGGTRVAELRRSSPID